ncbi:MAG TPA: hypothetical protein PKK15_06945 [Kouleothrix sp.]|nr:hypothetical protein [Kouleothrix sp.]
MHKTHMIGLAMYCLGAGLAPGDVAARVAPGDPTFADALAAIVSELQRPLGPAYPLAEELRDPVRCLRTDLQELRWG